MSSKCKKPCSSCAFRKGAAKNYFGANSIEVYASYYDVDEPIPCHTKSGVDDKGMLENKGDTPCIGHLIAQIKSCKSPHSVESQALIAQLRKQDNIGELKENALARWEFMPYHQGELETQKDVFSCQ